MGMEYHLYCKDCDEKAPPVEYSIIRGYQWKHIPDDPDTVMKDWTEFLVIHSGHRIEFLDQLDKETDPAGIRPMYVLLEDASQNTTIKDEIS